MRNGLSTKNEPDGTEKMGSPQRVRRSLDGGAITIRPNPRLRPHSRVFGEFAVGKCCRENSRASIQSPGT